MTKLEKLIEELCPGGVEYRKLKEVCDNIIVPMRDRPKVFDGDIPWCRIEDKEGQFFNGSKSGLAVSKEIVKKMNLKVFPTGTVICSCSASIGSYAINTQPLVTNQTFIGLVCGKEIYNKFLLYFMETQTKTLLKKATTGTIPYISRNKFEELLVPVPPLEIQSEIVHILDNLTELTAELNERLDAELTARKKQYEYYRDELLTFGDKSTSKTIESLCKISAGGDVPKESFSKEKTENFTIPIISNGIGENSIYGFTDVAKITSPAVTVAARGTIGYAEYRDYPYYPIIRLLSLVPKDPSELNTKFLYYCLQGKKYKVPQSGIPQLTAPMIKSVEIPVPNMCVQEKIVEVLDNFDAICSDLNIGLPAEIEARKKQYEYYRDKLLSFKSLSLNE